VEVRVLLPPQAVQTVPVAPEQLPERLELVPLRVRQRVLVPEWLALLAPQGSR